MSSDREGSESTNQRVSDYRVTTVDGEPALELPNGDTIVLRMFLDLPSDDRHGERVPLSPEVDSDGDNGSWWNLNPTDGDLYPWVTVQPEVDASE